MADIIQEFTMKAPPERVFEMFSTPDGLDRWWTKSSSGEPKEGAEYTLSFGPGYDWRGTVTRCVPSSAVEFLMHDSHADWDGTRLGCELKPEAPGVTRVCFYHTGWPEGNEHWRVSCHCWAMYLRVLRRYLEYGETVPFEKGLEV
jgi:uncharacterized protein YndB with AHSA1/START domain